MTYYLDTPYCFDPDSRQLRTVLTSPPVREVNTAAFAADLLFFRQLLEDACAGYDRLLQHPEYKPDEFFARWRDAVLAAGETVSVRSAAYGPMDELQRLAPSKHLSIVGAGPSANQKQRGRTAHASDSRNESVELWRDIGGECLDRPRKGC